MFGVGHASTAISAAVGFAAARDARGEDHSVVAVVGDGALTGGLAYEGLNNAGQLQTDLIVILNDNKMSISPNVGAIAKYLTRITSGKHYNRLEADLWDLLGKLPKGGKAQVLAGRIKESLKQLVVPTILFEELGFKYFGPIDGHDLPLADPHAATAVRKLKGPVLVHMITRRARATASPRRTASATTAWASSTGSEGIKVVKPTVAQPTPAVFGQTLVRTGGPGRPASTAITAAMPSGTGLSRLRGAPSRPLPRRGHRRGPRGDLRRGPGLRGTPPGGRDLLHLPAAGPGPDHPRRGPAAPAGGLRASTGAAWWGRTARPITASST